MTALPHLDEVDFYPSSDGKPMAETDLHVIEITALLSVLSIFFEDKKDVYVAANNLIYYTPGDLTHRFSPDVYVVFGVNKEPPRTSYMLWKEKNIPPTVVFEMTSRGTRAEDIGPKKDLCADLGVAEYFMFDPWGEYLKPRRLLGYRLQGNSYVEILPDKERRLYSEKLKLFLFVNAAEQLRAFDPVTGQVLTRHEESEREKIRERERADAESARANAADAEIERLKAELNRIKNQGKG